MTAQRGSRWTASRRAIAVAAASITVLAGAACSGDDENDSATTTTASEESSAEQTTTTLTDADYDEVVAEFSAAVEAAGSDICALVEAQGVAAPPEPATSAQVEQLIGVSALLLRSFASTVPEDPEAQAVLADAADAMEADAAEAGYPLDYISDPDELPEALTSEEFNSAIEVVSLNAQTQCTPDPGGLEAGDESTVPEAGGG